MTTFSNSTEYAAITIIVILLIKEIFNWLKNKDNKKNGKDIANLKYKKR